MGRLFDETELRKYIMHDGCEKGCGYIDERDLKYIQPVEAIPKADYEARLKADLDAILKEMSITIEEEREDCEKLSNSYERFGIRAMAQRSQIVIQQKIDKLKENKMAINDKDFYASHGLDFDYKNMLDEYIKEVINQAKIEVLTELKAEIEELKNEPACCHHFVRGIRRSSEVIQQKIDNLQVNNSKVKEQE